VPARNSVRRSIHLFFAAGSFAVSQIIAEADMTGNYAATFAFLAVFAAGSSGAAFAADGMTFGDKPNYQSDSAFSYALSDDKKSFGITFDAMEVIVDDGRPIPDAKRSQTAPKRAAAPTAPIATKAFAAVIPVKNGKPVKAKFIIHGGALLVSGTTASLLIDVNGRNTVFKIPAEQDGSFMRTFNYSAASASEIRLTVFLLIERDQQVQGTFGQLNVNSVATDLLMSKKTPPATSSTKK
jgi:hypothetical protein